MLVGNQWDMELFFTPKFLHSSVAAAHCQPSRGAFLLPLMETAIDILHLHWWWWSCGKTAKLVTGSQWWVPGMVWVWSWGDHYQGEHIHSETSWCNVCYKGDRLHLLEGGPVCWLSDTEALWLQGEHPTQSLWLRFEQDSRSPWSLLGTWKCVWCI
jgi:hypothetical protein